MAVVLEVHDLHYAYEGSDGEALAGVSFSLDAGTKTALVGPNGSGKSTLLLHLAGALSAVPGEAILLHGEPAKPEGLREAVGLIFQEPDDQLFMPSVLEDAAFGLVARGLATDEAQARALETLSALGISHLAGRPPHRLSGGEKRMAALAGILALSPEVLVLDEPTAALDPRARRRVIKTLQQMDKTILLATHDLDMALDVCHRAIVLCEGKLAAEGALPGLFRDEALLERCGLELPLRFAPLSAVDGPA